MIKEIVEAVKTPSPIKSELWSQFVKGLEALTKETGFGVETTGGVYFDFPGNIKSVKYSDDYSSGDISYSIKTKKGKLYKDD